ncbi:MAG: MBL fold metallo-hydrolase [Pseudomonadota bacterium]
MRLRVYQANDGDCLLLSSDSGNHVLIDGGRSSTFSKNTSDDLSALGKLDLVCVSHIDADHISGILKLLDDMVDWRIHEHERENPPIGRVPKRKPRSPRPPSISEIWINGFSEQLAQSADDALALVGLASSVQAQMSDADLLPRQHYLRDLALGEAQAIELGFRAGPAQLKIPINERFKNKLVRAGLAKSRVPIGSMALEVIGPFQSDLRKLRKEWKQWVAENTERVSEIEKDMDSDAQRIRASNVDRFLENSRAILTSGGTFGDRESITTPNLASIMFLAEENGKTVLMTGDGAGQDIVKGLEKTGRLDNGKIHVNVLKIQHHGATANIDQKFLKAVTADHYVFCGNGGHSNPELGVVQLIAQSRFGNEKQKSTHPKAQNRFELHFNHDTVTANTKSRKEHMTKVEYKADQLVQESNSQMSASFHATPFFDIVF